MAKLERGAAPGWTVAILVVAAAEEAAEGEVVCVMEARVVLLVEEVSLLDGMVEEEVVEVGGAVEEVVGGAVVEVESGRFEDDEGEASAGGSCWVFLPPVVLTTMLL